MIELSDLPTLNASLNALAFVLLLSGYIAIRKQNKILHRNLMTSALVVSAAFLASYLTYHYNTGHRVFPDLGWIKTVYLFILVPHVILAAVMVPMIILTFYRAFSGQWEKHKKIAKVTFPIWLYVSITGVVIYFFVGHYVGY